jgi:hypothetical protein
MSASNIESITMHMHICIRIVPQSRAPTLLRACVAPRRPSALDVRDGLDRSQRVECEEEEERYEDAVVLHHTPRERLLVDERIRLGGVLRTRVVARLARGREAERREEPTRIKHECTIIALLRSIAQIIPRNARSSSSARYAVRRPPCVRLSLLLTMRGFPARRCGTRV